MAHLSIRDLQKISSEKIAALAGPTQIKVGDRPIALLIPLKVADLAKAEAALRRAEELAKERDPEEDRRILAEFGYDDPFRWTIEAVQKFKEEELGIPSTKSAKRSAVRERARPFVARKRTKQRKADR
jgi:hypothetical protein